MKNWIKITVIILILVISIGLLVTYFIKYQENSFADEIITKASGKFESSFNKLLSVSSNAVKDLNLKISNENNFDQDKLTKDLSYLILRDKYISGIALSSIEFSYIIFREKNSWAVSFDTNLNDSISNWVRLNNKLEVISEWTDVYKAFPSKNQADRIKKQVDNNDFYWLVSDKVYSESGNNLSVIFTSRNQTHGNIFTGIIYQSDNLSYNFKTVLEFENPMVTLIAENNDLITPIITSDTVSISKYQALSKKVEGLIARWSNEIKTEARSFSFEEFGEIYWTRLVSTNTTIGIKGFAITLSANDLAETEKKQELLYLYGGLILLICCLIVYILLFHFKMSLKSAVSLEKELTNDLIFKIISKGESEFVEFKSSLRWDYREEKVNKNLEQVILKSINAFANAKGGNLFIGVSDDMEILGLEKDFSTLQKQDADYFELHLRKLIVNQYGIGFSNDKLNVIFPILEGKTICLIRIARADNPLFLKTKNKQGTEVEKFYVRSGNASHELSSLTEINKYVKRRF